MSPSLLARFEPKPPQLTIRDSTGNVSHVPLTAVKFGLGRSATNELSYPNDLSLSRNHLELTMRENEWWVTDLGSRNGTFVNAIRLKEPQRLRDGDEIVAGGLVIKLDPPKRISPDLTFVETAPQIEKAATFTTDLDGAIREGSTTLGWKDKKPIQALIRAGRELSGMMSLPELFRLILDLSIDASNAGRGVLVTVEKGELIPQATTGGAFQISTTVKNRVLEKRESVLIVDALADAQFGGAESIVSQRVRSFMAVPLQTGDKVIGFIYLDVVNFLQPFTKEDLSLVTVMANIAAIRIEQARLVEVEQKERIHEHEMGQAAEIQIGLLPSAPPMVDGLEMYGKNIPCRTVGGDYFDYFKYNDGRVALTVGDVAGKGMPAALMMSSLEARLQVLAESAPSPSELVNRLNKGLKKKCPGNRFVTFFYSVIDPITGHLAYTNAGHNPPIVIRHDGSIETLKAGGIVLGLIDMIPYEQSTITLNQGDTLVLFSDGVTEACQPHLDEEFGEDRIIEYVKKNPSASAEELVNGLIEALRTWSEGAPFADDVTVLVAKRPLRAA